VRIAALYDIHGNLPALEAVLAEVDADVVVVGGDFVLGPWPQETYERLRALEGDVRFIRGNADREVIDEQPGRAPPELMEFARARLSPDALEFLRSLPLTVSLGRVLFCHATPRNDEEIFTRISPDDRWQEALAGVDADVVVCGHTHIQFDRQIGDVRLVNAGSIGMPYERDPGAYWALFDGTDVDLRRTAYAPGDVSVWPGEWPEASPEEATEFFEKLSREQ
jgi:putative phosphoesterase